MDQRRLRASRISVSKVTPPGGPRALAGGTPSGDRVHRDDDHEVHGRGHDDERDEHRQKAPRWIPPGTQPEKFGVENTLPTKSMMTVTKASMTFRTHRR